MSENGLHKIPAMRSVLVAIQELHVKSGHNVFGAYCKVCLDDYPCATRQLADKGLEGDHD